MRECKANLWSAITGCIEAATHIAVMDGKEVPCCDDCWAAIATTEFWDFLTAGKPPSGFCLPDWEPLSPRQAEIVLYVVQEYLNALPDTYEMCVSCNRLIATGDEPYYRADDGKNYCEDCSMGECHDEEEGSWH